MIFTINTEKCTFCGLCADDCPARVIRINKASKTAEINNDKCIECAHCGMICPSGAVTADGNELPPYPDAAEIPESHKAAAELFEHLILSKRSIRKYNSAPLRQADIEAILLAGQLTATASNSRQVESIVLRGEQVKDTASFIARILLRILPLISNPAGRAVLRIAGLKRYAEKSLLSYFRRKLQEIIDGESDFLFFNAQAVIILTYSVKGKRFGRTDCALAGQNMMLTAQCRGIGSCMIGFAEAALWNKHLRRELGVAQDRRIGLIFTLGHTDRKYHRYPYRMKWEV